MNCEKDEMFSLISVRLGSGPCEYEPALTFQKGKKRKEKSKQFLPIIFGIHAKIIACFDRVVEIYVHYTTERFHYFFTQPVR